MCGVALAIDAEVGLINDSLIHRGPDGVGIWQSENIGIGHTRLSIIDLSEAGRQPMESERYVLSINGELYSYMEMKRYLCANDDLGKANLPEGNDSKTLLLYIEKFGLGKALNDINGMFSFILYDKQLKQVHLCVDRFAQKQLFYTFNPVFSVASSPNALLHQKPKWSINEQALQSYWKLGSVMHHSIWDGIKKVNAAEWVTYDCQAKTISTKRYWEPKYQTNTAGIEDLILDSINKVKVADVPIYIFLSGGIDSTLVASQFKGGNAIHLDSPELKYAQEAADKFGISLHSVTPAHCDPISAMTDYVTKSGEPGISALIPWITAKETAKFCKVAISANGADELFGGYNRISQDITQNQMDQVFRSCVDYKVELPEFDTRLSSSKWLELQTYVQFDLNKTLDFGAMASSLEVRSPFLDHRLVEMALSIPHIKHLDPVLGTKAILKRMLQNMGFKHEFLTRPKEGFSLHVQPPGLPELQNEAYDWAINEGYLKLISSPSKRDILYLKSSAFGFKVWYDTYKNIIQ